MRYGMRILILAGFAATLFAADPFVGTWKMDAAKAKYKTGTAPKEQTVTFAEVDKDLAVKVDGTMADGKKIAVAYTIPIAGGTGKMDSAAYDGVSSKTLGPRSRVVMYMKGGKAVYTVHSKVSADGKLFTVSAKGVNALGQTVDATAVYDKVN